MLKSRTILPVYQHGFTKPINRDQSTPRTCKTHKRNPQLARSTSRHTKFHTSKQTREYRSMFGCLWCNVRERDAFYLTPLESLYAMGIVPPCYRTRSIIDIPIADRSKVNVYDKVPPSIEHNLLEHQTNCLSAIFIIGFDNIGIVENRIVRIHDSVLRLLSFIRKSEIKCVTSIG